MKRNRITVKTKKAQFVVSSDRKATIDMFVLFKEPHIKPTYERENVA